MVKQLAHGHQLVNDRARIQTQTRWPQSLSFDHRDTLSQGRLNPALPAAEWTTHSLTPEVSGASPDLSSTG